MANTSLDEFVAEFDRWREDFEKWKRTVWLELEKRKQHDEAIRTMINTTTANALAVRVVATISTAGVKPTDQMIDSIIDALAPIRRDPNNEFRPLVRGTVHDILMAADEWKKKLT